MNDEFSDDLTAKLKDLEDHLQTQTARSPSTAEKAVQSERQRLHRESVRARVAALRAHLTELRGAAAPLSPAIRNELEQKWVEIERLLARDPLE
jgi:hypothetical protein